MPSSFSEPYASGGTVCHRMPVPIKLLLTIAVIVGSALIPIAYWPAHGCLICLVFVGLSIAEIPLAYLGRRLLLLVPLLGASALAIPLSRGFAGGWETAMTILVRSMVGFLAALWLVSSTPFDRLVATLCRFGLPRLFASLLIFTERYIHLLFDELARMKTARRARTFRKLPAWRIWIETTHLVGMLLIRTLDRAERVHWSFVSRGWRGKMRSLD